MNFSLRSSVFQAAQLHTKAGVYDLRLRVAHSFWSRFRGLMLTPPLTIDAGFLILACASVHSMFMRYAIDIVYLDDAGQVLQCVPNLSPWKISIANLARTRKKGPSAVHTLELAAGSIHRFQIETGDTLCRPKTHKHVSPRRWVNHRRMESGSAMTEFVVVGPIIALLGLAIVQYGLLFFAKNQINHASFMAARAGSVGNASLEKVHGAFMNAMVPLYGGGVSRAEMAESLARAQADLAGKVRIELLNPTRESFDDHEDPALQTALKTGANRVISNSNLAFKAPQVKPASGQTIQDANIIKLRITHGYEPKVPIVSNIYKVYLKWLDPGKDAFHSQLVAAGRIPVVTHVTMQMQSHAIEDNPVSMPGIGNGGSPAAPAPGTTPSAPGSGLLPPECATISCRPPQPGAPPVADPPVDPGGICIGDDCPVCPQPPA